jgi:hypothetical protein
LGGDELIKTIIEIIAKNPPSIAIAIAGLLIISGQSKEAYDFLYAGIFMQIVWIIGKYILSR